MHKLSEYRFRYFGRASLDRIEAGMGYMIHLANSSA